MSTKRRNRRFGRKRACRGMKTSEAFEDTMSASSRGRCFGYKKGKSR